MASRGQSLTLTYVAWDTDANAGKTGDVANHTLRWIKDGTSAAPDNSPAEVDATNAPGVYKVVLTGTECTANVGTLCGKSSTADVSLMPITVTFEQLPTAAPDAAGGLPTTTKITDARLAVLTDWINDGRLDLLLDAIPTTAMRGTDGANTTVPPSVAQFNARTLVAAEYGTLAGQTAIESDTNELQTDWADGGRLDVLLDAVSGVPAITLSTEGSNLSSED